MNYPAIANVLGKLLIVTGTSLAFPLICSLMFLYAVCFIGACAGSTTSGIKVVFVLEHAGGPAGDVLGPGDLLPLVLEAVRWVQGFSGNKL